MRNLTRNGVIAAVAATALCAIAPAPASAMPVTGAQTVKADNGVTEIRYRRQYARRTGYRRGYAKIAGKIRWGF